MIHKFTELLLLFIPRCFCLLLSLSSSTLMCLQSLPMLAMMPLPLLLSALVALSSAVHAASAATAVIALSPWTTTSDGQVLTITPSVYAGVTVSPSPTPTTASSASSKWVSLDSSGIPYDTTAVVSGTITLNPSPTPSASDEIFYQTAAPVLGCWAERLPTTDDDLPGVPFCTPHNASELVVGETYFVTWDPSYFGGGLDDIVSVKLQGRALGNLTSIDDDDDLIFETGQITNAYGFYPLTILENFTSVNYEGYFYLNIIPVVPSDSNATHTGTKSGPILRAIDSVSDALYSISRLPSDNVQDDDSGNSSYHSGLERSAKIAIGVVVPLAVIFVICILVYMIHYKHRGARIRAVFGSRGYGVRESRADRVKSNFELGHFSDRRETTAQ
ncbi:hypothetical protein BZA70DRAFT_278679 [Myxozyma melibiosi]|uniref:Mid2 domain-containing protein n=1 Tax=Myxozyma melibiosi TaxID=54550 RepID=A0ABR1F731_9ASCO